MSACGPGLPLYQVADSLNMRHVRGRTREGKEQSPHPPPPEGLGERRQAGSGLRRVMEKKKMIHCGFVLRVLACALKAKEMICEVIEMSPISRWFSVREPMAFVLPSILDHDP